MGSELNRVGIVAGLPGVVDPGAQIQLHQPGHEPQLTGQLRGGIGAALVRTASNIGHAVGGCVGIQGTAQNVCRQVLIRLRTGDRTAGRFGAQNEILWPGQRRGYGMPAAECKRQRTATDGDGVRYAGSTLAEIERPSQPPETASLLRIEACALPDGYALEVRAIGIWVAHALDNGQAMALQQLACIAQRRMQADGVVDLDQAGQWQAQHAAVPGIALVGERDHRVDAVVAAIELDHDQDPAVFLRFGRRAVWARNLGTVGARASTVECFRKLRRESMSRSPGASSLVPGATTGCGWQSGGHSQVWLWR